MPDITETAKIKYIYETVKLKQVVIIDEWTFSEFTYTVIKCVFLLLYKDKARIIDAFYQCPNLDRRCKIM